MGHYLVPFSKTGMTRMMIKNEEIIINIRYVNVNLSRYSPCRYQEREEL
jgi:hypothetical protein